MFQWPQELFCIMDWFRRDFVYWSLSGILLGVGFLFPSVWVLSLVGGASFLYLLTAAGTIRQAFWGAWLAWTTKAACAVWWFWSVYPIEWLPVALGKIQLLLIFLYWLTTAMWLGLGVIVPVVLVRYFLKHFPTAAWFIYSLLFPLTWVLGEMIGSVVFSILYIGPGGVVTPAFSFGYSGYLLAHHELLLMFAKLGGVYVLSAAFAFLSAILLRTFSQTERSLQGMAVGLLVVLCGTSFFHSVPPISNDGYRVVTIDTRLESKQHASEHGRVIIRQTLTEAMGAALAQDPEYIILPEDSRFFDQSRPASTVRSLFALQYDNPNSVVVDSGRAAHQGKTVLQTFIYDGPESGVVPLHKRYLVPQGEFMPSLYIGFLRLFGYGAVLDYLGQAISYEVGDLISQRNVPEHIPGILFCFESVDPQGVRSLVAERPQLPFVAHVVSHAWFHDPVVLREDLDLMLRIQAVWNQKYIVSAGNNLRGKVYAPNGTVYDLETIAEGERWAVRQTTVPR